MIQAEFARMVKSVMEQGDYSKVKVSTAFFAKRAGEESYVKSVPDDRLDSLE